MKKFYIYMILIGCTGFIVLQFIQPEKNDNETIKGNIFLNDQFPEEVKNILQNSCFDCHSNKTVYAWYDKVSPVSWMVNKHIKKGKKELNFSDWSDLNAITKISGLQDIQKVVEKKRMPLKSYTLMHKNARLSVEERKVLTEWCKIRMNELMEELK